MMAHVVEAARGNCLCCWGSNRNVYLLEWRLGLTRTGKTTLRLWLLSAQRSTLSSHIVLILRANCLWQVQLYFPLKYHPTTPLTLRSVPAAAQLLTTVFERLPQPWGWFLLGVSCISIRFADLASPRHKMHIPESWLVSQHDPAQSTLPWTSSRLYRFLVLEPCCDPSEINTRVDANNEVFRHTLLSHRLSKY